MLPTEEEVPLSMTMKSMGLTGDTGLMPLIRHFIIKVMVTFPSGNSLFEAKYMNGDYSMFNQSFSVVLVYQLRGDILKIVEAL